MHELLATHMVRWEHEKMRRPEWQHTVALAMRRRGGSRRQLFTARFRRLRSRWARPDQALAAGTR
jgi:hypothetical protein